ncbi:MAG: hypothetical protein MUF27_00020 [Acidobacteria bacterium]|jgi:hypothetical protein|nr:hypothetical protein [Acidobacteriota bacterium]
MPGGSEGEEQADRPIGRGRRILRALVLSVVGLCAVYLVAANLLLQTPFIESLTNKRPEKLLITYRRAFTFFPGHVLAYGVSVRNQASRSQLQITADRVWAVANPLPLLAKEVRILKGKVRGPKVWLRSRPETAEEQRASEPFVPPIEGLPFSLRVPRKFRPPSQWRFVIEAVEVLEVREFWYQSVRVKGPGTVRGAFTIGPARRVEVRWDECDFPALELLFRNETVLPAAELRSTGRITPFESDEEDVARLLSHFSGLADLKGITSRGLAAVQPLLAGVAGLSLAGEPLEYTVAVRMESGALVPGTRVDLSTARGDASFRGLHASAALRLAATIGGVGPARGLDLDLALDGLRVRAEGRDGTVEVAGARTLHAVAGLPGLALGVRPKRADLGVTVADLRIDNLLDLPPDRTRGRVGPRLDVALEGNARAAGQVELGDGGGFSARWGPVEFSGLRATADGRTIVDRGRLASTGSVGPIPKDSASRGAWASTISGTVDLELMAGPELAALQPILGPRAGFSLSGGPVRVALKGAVDRGRPAAGSTLSLRSDRVGVRAGKGLEALGAIDLDAVLTGDGAGRADVVLGGLVLRLPAAGAAVMRGERVALKAAADGITLRGLPRQLSIVGDLSGLRYDGAVGPRARALSATTAGPVLVDAGVTTTAGATLLRWGPLEVPGLAVRLDGQPLLDELRLATRGTLGPVALSRRIDGRRLLESLSGRVQLDARTPAGLAGLRALLPADAQVAFGGDAVNLAADVSLEHGVALPGSRVAVRSDGLEVTASGVVARAAVDLTAQVKPENELALETTLTGISVTHPEAETAAGRGERLVLTAHAPLGALQGPRKAFDFTLSMTELNLDDVARLDDPLPRKVQEEIGPDTVRLDLALAGTARIAGNLALGPGSQFLLDCDTVDFPHLDLDIDGTALLARATVAGKATLGPYDYGTRERGGILPVTSGRALLTARTAAGLRALNNLLKNVQWLEFEGGIGFVTLEAVAEKGSLMPGSSATLQLDDLALTVTDFRAGGDANVRAWIGSDAGGEFGELEAELTDVKVSRRRTEGLAEAEGVTLQARTRELQLGKAPKDVDVKVALRNARLDTIVGLNGLLPKGTGVVFTDGSARVDAELAGSSGGKDGNGSIRVRGERLAMSAPGYDFVGDVAVDVPLSDGDLLAGSFKIDGATVGLSQFDVAGGETGRGDWTTGWWANVGVDDADLVLKGEITAAGDVSLKMRDTAPIVQFFTSRTHLPRFLARAMDVSDVSGSAVVSYSPERVEVKDLEIVSNRAQAKARLQVDDRKPAGQLLIVYDWIGVGIGLGGKKTELDLLGARHWYARLGPDPPEDLDAYVDEEIAQWRATKTELKKQAASDEGP